ncbi:MAG: hypothetical protein OJF49_002541 [Ktedonobacterales bacterium]|nr:MAG: hypothetical protein OJF49_002541 [Ktedonobacterales bacterium]
MRQLSRQQQRQVTGQVRGAEGETWPLPETRWPHATSAIGIESLHATGSLRLNPPQGG